MRERLARYVSAASRSWSGFAERDLVVEVRANRMPDGGIVTTFTDITPSVKAAEELERANESLERRVRERTEELTRLNTALGRAKARGRGGQHLQDALSRRREPRHSAAAQCRAALRHQPGRAPGRGGEDAALVGNVDASLDAVEEILGALLDISRLDTGGGPASGCDGVVMPLSPLSVAPPGLAAPAPTEPGRGTLTALAPAPPVVESGACGETRQRSREPPRRRCRCPMGHWRGRTYRQGSLRPEEPL